jgi:hypothetical protein
MQKADQLAHRADRAIVDMTEANVAARSVRFQAL